MNKLLVLGALLGASFAAPAKSSSTSTSVKTSSTSMKVTPTPTQASCTTYTDDYDNLSPNPLAPALTPITELNGLVYTHWDVKKVAPLISGVSTTGFTPHTSPNVIVAGAINDAATGSMTPTPFGTISAAAGTKSFDLKSFYFACNIATGQSLVGDAESCTLSVYGYFANNQQAPVQTFTFTNTVSPNIMQYAVLPSTYVNLQNVTLGIAGAGTNVLTAAVDVDSLVHCNHV